LTGRAGEGGGKWKNSGLRRRSGKGGPAEGRGKKMDSCRKIKRGDRRRCAEGANADGRLLKGEGGRFGNLECCCIG